MCIINLPMKYEMKIYFINVIDTMLHLMEKDAFHHQNLGFNQPPGDKGSVDNLRNCLTLQ